MSPQMNRKIYLGDGAYVQDFGYQLLLTTSNGSSNTNSIVLGEREVDVLLEFIKEQWGDQL